MSWIYSYQNNRNPFIDYPDLAEHIWGDKTSQEWYSTDEVTPMITFPVDGSVLNMGVTATNVALEKELIVKGVALNENVSVTVSGAGFSASTTSLGYAQVNAEGGASVMVKYYSIEIREQALKSLAEGNKQKDVAKIFGITRQTLSSWVKLKKQKNSLKPDVYYNKLKFKRINDEEFIKYMSSDNPNRNYNKTKCCCCSTISARFLLPIIISL